MDAGNTLCSMCGNRAAEVFCPCTTPETFLCVNCIGPHNVKRAGRTHPTWPIGQLSYYKIPGYAERVQTRLDHFPQVSAQALQQVTLVDKAIEEFAAAIEDAIWELVQYSDKTLDQLNQFRTELDRETKEGLAEVERTLTEDKPRLTSLYGNAFRGLTEKLEPFETFVYSIKTSSPHEVVTLQSKLHPPLLQSELHPPLPPSNRGMFAVLYEYDCYLYNLETQETTTRYLPTKVETGYLNLNENTMLVVGKEVWTLNLLTFQKTTMGSLRTPRDRVGVTKVDDVVFAFGGRGSLYPSTACEKYSLSRNSWTSIHDMNYGRCEFTPCHFQSLIYLVSTNDKSNRAIESFNPKKEKFTILSVSLHSLLTLGYNSATFMINDELFILGHENQMARWKIQSEQEFRIFTTEWWEIFGCTEPLVVGTQVLLATSSGVKKLSLDTFTFV